MLESSAEFEKPRRVRQQRGWLIGPWLIVVVGWSCQNADEQSDGTGGLGSAASAGAPASGGSANAGSAGTNAGSGAANAASGGSNAGASAGGEGNGGGAGNSAPGDSGGAGAAAGTSGGEGDSGAAGSNAVSCDPREIFCRRLTPVCGANEVPSVEGTCYGPCVPVEACTCAEAAACPQPNTYTCHLDRQRCGPFVR